VGCFEIIRPFLPCASSAEGQVHDRRLLNGSHLEFGGIGGIIIWSGKKSRRPEMKAYLFLMIAALWIAVAVILNRTSFGFFWHRGTLNPARVAMIFRLAIPVIFFGWIVPTVLGFWLLWAKK
jgi:hypothetical protein